ASQVKVGQAARAHLVGPGARDQRVDREIQELPDKLDRQDTVTRAHVWDTMLELHRITGMITEEKSPSLLILLLPLCLVQKHPDIPQQAKQISALWSFFISLETYT
ncbi:hypothetical protein XENORESO_017195, partial [Xenotaenia resolanae]